MVEVRKRKEEERLFRKWGLKTVEPKSKGICLVGIGVEIARFLDGIEGEEKIDGWSMFPALFEKFVGCLFELNEMVRRLKKKRQT